MSKRKKKRDKSKVYKAVVNSIVKPLACTYVTGDDYANVFNNKLGKLIPVDLNTAKILSEVPYKWSVLIAALCRDEEGNEYIKDNLITTSTPYLQRELVEVLSDKHSTLINGCNQKHLIGAGWIASPVGKEWEAEESFNLFKTIGGFNRVRNPNDNKVYVTE